MIDFGEERPDLADRSARSFTMRSTARKQHMTDTPSAPGAQAPSRRRRFHVEPAPIDPATRRRRIKVARAFNLICRSKCSVSVALRATGLDHDHNAREDVADLLDRRNIPRIKRGVRRVRVPSTPSRNFETFIPRQEETRVSRLPPSRRALAELVAELRALIADPLGDDGGEIGQLGRFKNASGPEQLSKPKPIATCTCGATFEGRAKFCSVRCRVRDWRARQ